MAQFKTPNKSKDNNEVIGRTTGKPVRRRKNKKKSLTLCWLVLGKVVNFGFRILIILCLQRNWKYQSYLQIRKSNTMHAAGTDPDLIIEQTILHELLDTTTIDIDDDVSSR